MKPTSPHKPFKATNPHRPSANLVNVKKLLLSKWTAVQPIDKRKHFLVAKVIAPELPELAVQWVELEAVHSNLAHRVHWHELRDPALWSIGWV